MMSGNFLVDLVGHILLLQALVERGQAPESLLVVVRGVLGHQIGTRAIDGLAVLGNRIGEVPHHGPRLGVAKGMATMVLHDHADDAARGIGLPVLAFGRRLLGVGQLVPPTQLLDQHMVKLGVAGGDVCAQ
jgi:hypothetical protein